MDGSAGRWLSTEQIAERVGMTSEWVRRQVLAGRLRAVVYRTGNRATYRVREADFRQFIAIWSVSADRPEWEDFLAGIPVSDASRQDEPPRSTRPLSRARSPPPER